MRRDDRIADFKRLNHNPVYLSDVRFDTDRIYFSSDINDVCNRADTLLLAMPSPYIKSHLAKLTVDISDKNLVSAVKGIVPDENLVVSEYMKRFYGVHGDRLVVVSGPCHAEEVALERLSYLTVGSTNEEMAADVAKRFNGKSMRTILFSRRYGHRVCRRVEECVCHCCGIVPRNERRRQFPCRFVVKRDTRNGCFRVGRKPRHAQHLRLGLSGRLARDKLFALQPQPTTSAR